MKIYWREMDRTVLVLQVSRGLRSIGQGIAVVDLTLYLKDLKWTATQIGGVLSGAAVIGALLMLFVGITSDRWGRKPFLIVYEALTVAAALVLGLTSNALAMTAAILVTGFGRGQNGSAGPFTPAEQAWMAVHVPRSARGRVFSLNTAVGAFGMTAGALIAGVTHWWAHNLPGASQFRPLFIVIALFSVVTVVVLLMAPRETHRSTVVADDSTVEKEMATVREKTERSLENRRIVRLAAVNVLNGLGVGLFGPMMAYWFAVRFGASSAAIGLTLAAAFAVTGFSSLATGALAQKFGMVRSVVWLRIGGVALLLALPLMPSFALASVIYVARSALNRGTQGARSALSSSLTRDQRRGFSVSVNSFAMRMASAIGPTISGYLLDSGDFALPFFIAAALQFSSAILYQRLFGSYDESSATAKRSS